MNIEELSNLPIARIKVRALVKCREEYLFIQRCRKGKTKKYLVFPGGRLKKSDRAEDDKKNILKTLKSALVRELEEELGAKGILIGDMLSISKPIEHDREVLFFADIDSYDWDAKTGKEFTNPSKGTYELIKVSELSKLVLGKKGYHLKPKQWRKLLYSLDI